MMENKTMIQQMQDEIRFRRGRVCDLLQWTQGKYVRYVYASGNAFLCAFMSDQPEARVRMRGRVEFWNWWKQQWAIRDEAWLYEVDGLEDSIPLKDRLVLYDNHNNIQMLSAVIHPPRLVYGNEFTNIQTAAL